MKTNKVAGVVAVTALALFVCNSRAVETNSVEHPKIDVPGYSFNLEKVDASQVLDIYANIARVELKRTQPLPDAAINLKTDKPLTRAEAIKTLEKVLREQAGIVLKPLDAKHVEAALAESVKVKN